MKRILITGAGSYIGASFAKYLTDNFPNAYEVDTVDMLTDSWKETSFSSYDAIFHVAGIAHIKETQENAPLYYKVNRDLPVQVAEKAKADGVSQFVFLSTMSVYGMETGVITKDTIPCPKSNYGKSKLQAEQGLSQLADDHFKVVILRPPMVFGAGCKGNYQTIAKIVDKLPVFPKVKNQRSLIYIDNLCSFVKMAIDKELSGLYFPDNAHRVDTFSMAKAIADAKGKKIWFSSLLGLCAKAAGVFIPMARKAFGTLVYSNTEDFAYCYCVVNNADALRFSAEQEDKV
ncbi:MAG: NAD-dependent epimerase/dehydratase family protein [Oscillospiraceae bacterium]|nr:NAD-dependent epimerase/dehydratase family protein [Oscillospiraceae bacterium]